MLLRNSRGTGPHQLPTIARCLAETGGVPTDADLGLASPDRAGQDRARPSVRTCNTFAVCRQLLNLTVICAFDLFVCVDRPGTPTWSWLRIVDSVEVHGVLPAYVLLLLKLQLGKRLSTRQRTRMKRHFSLSTHLSNSKLLQLMCRSTDSRIITPAAVHRFHCEPCFVSRFSEQSHPLATGEKFILSSRVIYTMIDHLL